MNKLLRIAVTGPESTGKSILTRQLAEHFNTAWVPEYARDYIGSLKRAYLEEDILKIARGQLAREELSAKGTNKVLFCDTELIVTKIWSEVRFGRCHPWILKTIDAHRYDLYLLCYIDIPWVNDPQREHPHMRERLFKLYQDELVGRNLPFAVVRGTGTARLENALRLISNNFDL